MSDSRYQAVQRVEDDELGSDLLPSAATTDDGVALDAPSRQSSAHVTLRACILVCCAIVVTLAGVACLLLVTNPAPLAVMYPLVLHRLAALLPLPALSTPVPAAHSATSACVDVGDSPTPPVVHRNHQRWARVLEKLERGEPLVVGALGGSVTVQPNGYPLQLLRLLNHSYPVKAAADGHRLYNLGAGSMTSDGISLCLSNLFTATHPTIPLPDIITIEYALNDGAGDHYSFGSTEADLQPMAAFRPQDNIERIARTYLDTHRLHAAAHPANDTSSSTAASAAAPAASNSSSATTSSADLLDGPALLLVYFSNSGQASAEDSHALVGRHYGIPSVSWRDQYLRDWRLGERMYQQNYTVEAMYGQYDNRHPHPETGHLLMAHLIMDELKGMASSYALSNKTGLSVVERSPRLHSSLPTLLSSPAACLPAPLNRYVLWTISDTSYCGITYLPDTSGRERSPAERLSVVSSEGWEVHRKDQKHSYHPIDEARTGQSISVRPPRSFDRIAFVLIIRSWNATWANASMALSASAELVAARPHCASATPPPPVVAVGHWDSPSTQSTGVVAWQQDEQAMRSAASEQPASSCLDTLTITKLTPGEFRFIGYYAA